jgi:glycosyltransferase involved in cell wall biosynthesis
MSFASAWLDQRALYPQFIPEPPAEETGIIVVVPTYNEEGIASMLHSLHDAERPRCKAEVIVVVNAPAEAQESHLLNNTRTIADINTWKQENTESFFSIYHIEPSPIPGWGVGLARKTGMDEALRRFNSIDRPEGIIVCLDADCTVSGDYFKAIEQGFDNRKREACSIYFEHPLEKTKDEKTSKAIILYELHLRYYYQSLLYTGLPGVFHTVGSAMAVRALAYMKSGGMNRKQAGEDFYFIQKLIPQGGYFSLDTTTVYPLPRPSFRVPFGTGATMEKLLKGNDPEYKTYNPEAFSDLKRTFAALPHYYADPETSYKKLPGSLRVFITDEEWNARLAEIKNNTSGYESFRKRFFFWFNMFKVVKYLNLVHEKYFQKERVEICAAELLGKLGVNYEKRTPANLLTIYRSMEKKN